MHLPKEKSFVGAMLLLTSSMVYLLYLSTFALDASILALAALAIDCKASFIWELINSLLLLLGRSSQLSLERLLDRVVMSNSRIAMTRSWVGLSKLT